jgi:rubrerythrin
MEKYHTLEDVITFAVQREETAYQLYKSAAEKTTSISARKMFEELAAEEAGHKEVFGRIDLAKSEQYRFTDIPDMKIAEYMTNVPFRPDMAYDEILRFAMKAEEHAYQLYLAAADATDDPKLKKTLQVFADVEKGHKHRIEAIYDERVLTEM